MSWHQPTIESVARGIANPSHLCWGHARDGCVTGGLLLQCLEQIVRKTVRGLWVIGTGMTPRGKVGLIFASAGHTVLVAGTPVLGDVTFLVIITMVMLTTLVAPPLLKAALRRVGPGGHCTGGGPFRMSLDNPWPARALWPCPDRRRRRGQSPGGCGVAVQCAVAARWRECTSPNHRRRCGRTGWQIKVVTI